MKKYFVYTFSVLAVMLLFLSSCATMRYESFDSGVANNDDPWTEKEVILKNDLWQDAAIIEDFDDGDIDPYFQNIINHSKKSIEDGILHINRIEKDNVFAIYTNEGFESIALCFKTKSGVYISSHTKRGGNYQYDIEPWITFNSSGIFVDLWCQNTKSQTQLYRSESSFLNKWIIVELRDNEGRLEFYVNGKKKGSADIDGRKFPGITFHLTNDSNEAEIDYIILK